MVLLREFEDSVQRAFLQGLVPGTTHLYTGQEAVAVGFAAASSPGDYWTYTYRGHGHVLARGMSPLAAMSEIFGRSNGCNRGRGGSMHLTDKRLGLMGSFAIVGAGIPIAVGLARAAQLSGSGKVSVTFFGDGATNIGAFHEGLNLAAVWEVPAIFVCENNLYGEYSRYHLTTKIDNLADRATAYGMPGVIVDGNDVMAVYKTARSAIDRARSGGGPTLVEAKTYRHRGHSRTDMAKYRPPEEVAAWMDRDPLKLARGLLVEGKHATEAELDALVEEIARQVAVATEEAVASSWPAVEGITRNVHL
jgi:TPP-dependent pyruvate/acetoin dehydrogenase alpha subunit